MSTASTPTSGGTPKIKGQGSTSWEEWTQQLQAYVNWVNSQLKKRQGCRMVEDLRRDMQDGVALIHLVEIVSGESLARVEHNPATTTAMRDNVERVLQFMASKKIRMHHTSAKDIVDGNLKAIMRLILALAAHYKPGSVKQSPAAATGSPSRKPASRQPSFAANLASAQVAIQDARKEAAGAGSSLRRYKEQRGLHGLPPQSPSGSHKDQIHRRRGTSGRDATDGDVPTKSSSRKSPSPLPSILTSSPTPSPIPSPALLIGRHRSGSPRLGHTSDSDQGSAAEDAGSRSSSRRSSINVGYTTEMLIEEQHDMTRELEETKRVIQQLQELLLSGRLPDDEGSSEAEEDQIPFEGSNAKEQVVVLQARLSQRQDECNQLRNEMSKVKQECRNLQGTKAGLQSRLTEQDNALLQMKAELLRVGFTQQNLEGEKSELKRKLEEKDRVLSDLRAQQAQKDKLLKQQQEQIEMVTQQLQDLNVFKTELQNQLENKGTTTTQDLESQIEELSQRLEGVGIAEANLATHISAQDRKLTRIEGKVQSGIRIPATFKEGSDEMSTLRSALRSLRTNMSSHDPNHHALDSLEQGISAMMEQINPSLKDTLRRDSDSSSTESSALRHSYDNHRRSPSDREYRASPTSNYGHRQNSFSPTPNGNAGTPCTKVLYFTERAVTPFMTSIPKRLGEVTLRDFKLLFDRDGNYRYHFKALDPEFGTVKEEVIDDDDILPGWEGKIVGWIEEDTG
ncbi:dixin-like isoform X2 [Amphiura filiformis]|uniref:dixin-like isoform X2 n=1 Tax=Amphiura filiformis TaxID=82378 RepID=UPI003B214767